jgi:hypothetical protein
LRVTRSSIIFGKSLAVIISHDFWEDLGQ